MILSKYAPAKCSNQYSNVTKTPLDPAFELSHAMGRK